MPLNKVTLAPNIHIKWNPVTDDGNIRLDFREFIIDDTGKVTSYTDLENVDIHFDDISTLAMRVANLGSSAVDPVTGQTLPPVVSGAAIMFAIKRLVDTIIEEKAQQAIRQMLQPAFNQTSAREFIVDLTNLDFSKSGVFLSAAVDWGDGSDVVTTTDNLQPLLHEFGEVVEPTTFEVVVNLVTDGAGSFEFQFSAYVEPVLSNGAD